MDFRYLTLYGIFFSSFLLSSCRENSEKISKPENESILESVNESGKAVIKKTIELDADPVAVRVPTTHLSLPLPPPIPVVIDNRHMSLCGDGVKQDNEQCDDGDGDNGDDCDNLCRIVKCGNGIVEGNEECDGGLNSNCTYNCKLKLCGNGVIDPGELCDPPNESLRCNNNCQPSRCGNNLVEFGEECDAGTENGSSNCTANCMLVIPPG